MKHEDGLNRVLASRWFNGREFAAKRSNGPALRAHPVPIEKELPKTELKRFLMNNIEVHDIANVSFHFAR